MKKNNRLGIKSIIIFSLIAIVLIISAINTFNDSEQSTELAKKVESSLNKVDEETRGYLAGTDGYSGTIESIQPAIGDGTVKITVSTNFEKPEDGKVIARNIFNTICADVPDLNSIYVIGSNGLESSSIYRSESACE